MPTVVKDERIIRVQYGTKTWEFISVSVSDYWIRSVDERFSEGQLWTTVGFSMTAPRFVTIKILRLCYSLCCHICLAFSLGDVRSKTYFNTFYSSPNQIFNLKIDTSNSSGPALQILPIFGNIPYSYPCLLNFPSNHSVVKFYWVGSTSSKH